ncbi:MAG: indole-3-glycerol phosphate synthase TrpC [Gemmatimonadaceae bacterium]
MQVEFLTVPASGPLGRLVDKAQRLVASELQHQSRSLRAAAERALDPPRFGQALMAPAGLAVVAELKRSSPSKGALNPTLDVASRAQAYAEGGASALSVLTEASEFGGSLGDLRDARRAVPLAILRKDFLVHPLQVWESRANGASAVLLIARALGAHGLGRMLAECREARLEALVEVRSASELGWAVDSGARIVGVNARDLETLELEPDVVADVLPRIPASLCAVAESGISRRADVEQASGWGADAVLVGSALSLAADPTLAVSELTGVPRRTREESRAR